MTIKVEMGSTEGTLKHQLGDVVQCGESFYLVVQLSENEEFTYLNLADYVVYNNSSYSSLATMFAMNVGDIIHRDCTLTIN